MRSAGNLFHRVVDPENLCRAMNRAARGKSDRAPVARFLANADRELSIIRDELRDGAYQPRPYRQFRIRDPKPRLITCAAFRDRVVHHALCAVIAPVFERRFIGDSFACRVGMGAHRAVLRSQHFARRYPFYWKSDIRRFYDSIDHDVLLALLRRRFRERALFALCERIVLHPVPGREPGRGLPIGNLTSQWFSNLYLDPFDHYVKEQLRAPGYVRYMDDFAIWTTSRDTAFRVWADACEYLREELRLKLKPAATVVAPTSEGMPFLGMRVYPGCIRVQRRRLRHTRRLLARREREYQHRLLDDRALAGSVGASLGLFAFFRLSGLWSTDLDV